MLHFGLPLENVFPEEGNDYGIKNFMFEAYDRISSGNVSVQDVLRKYQGSVEERLMLKHRLILGKNINNELKITPGSLLWVVRHFIGLLEIPLLPETDKKGDCPWIEITKMCKTSVVSYITRGRYNTELVELIAKKLAKLPRQSFILTVNLFDTMRMLAVLPAGEPRINKASAFALVEYFSSSLFIRPFHPGSTHKIVKQYYPLTLFLILKWTEIKNCCIQFRKIKCDRKIPRDILYTKRQFLRQSTLKCNVDLNLSDEEIRCDPPFDMTCDSPFDMTCDYLQDVACQTDDVRSNLQENCFKKCCGILKSHEENQRSETKIIYIKQKCCCTYGTNYESMLSHKHFSDLEEEQIRSDLECKKKQSTVSFAGVDKEIIPYEKIQHFDPVEKEIAGNSIITKKIAKVGWSYTSDSPKYNFDDDGSKHDSMESISNIGWNLKSESADSFENMRKSLNAELKEKFIQKEEEKEISEEFQCASKSDLPRVCGSVSKESRISVNRIKQKLNILKAFSDKKNNSKKNLNCNRAESKIKYKRIGSENSIDKC